LVFVPENQNKNNILKLIVFSHDHDFFNPIENKNKLYKKS